MWNDGVTKELNDFLNDISEGGKIDIPETYVEAVKETITNEVKNYSDFIDKNVPVDTGALKNSFVVEEIKNRDNYFGYSAYFKGENSKGVAYQKIANILNYGVPGKFAGRFFVTRAIRRLKGMNERIDQKFRDKLRDKGVE